MRVSEHQRLPVLGAREPGMFLVLPLPLDLGGRPGTGSGAAWLGERLAAPATAALVGASYETVAPLMCEVPFGRLEPSLYSAATTLQAWALGYRPLWLFGDHGLSYGPVRAAATRGKPVTVFVFDAHFDRSDALLARLGMRCALENEVHQGNVSTWIGRDPGVRKLIQIGIRQQLAEADVDAVPRVEVFSAEQIRHDPARIAVRMWSEIAAAVDADSPIVLSIDVDVLDPEIEPAVDHRLPNGLSLGELVHLAAPVAQAACSVDLAELNPLRDDDDERGCRAALLVATALLNAATPALDRRSWRGMLGYTERALLAPIGPYTQTFADATHWFEPDAVEGAILDGYAPEELHATFTADALRSAVAGIRENIGPRETLRCAAPAASRLELRPSRELRSPERHVECVGASYDGALIAAAGWDHAVYVWSREDANEAPRVLAGHQAWVVAMAFSPCDARLATVSDDGTLRVWNPGDERAQPLICAGHDCWVKSVAWSPDGRLVATGDFDGTLGVWDADSGEPLLFHRAHRDTIWGLAWSPDRSLLVSCGERGIMRAWRPLTGELQAEYAGHLGSVERCRFVGSALWSLNRSGELLRHDGLTARPALRVRTPYRQASDLGVLRASARIVLAGETSISCLAADGTTSLDEIDVGFSAAAVASAGEACVVVGGDSDVVALYDLGGATC